MVEAKRPKLSRAPEATGAQADGELKEMLATADPVVETSLEILHASEEHYFAAVHQEGNRQPTTFSSSAEA